MITARLHQPKNAHDLGKILAHTKIEVMDGYLETLNLQSIVNPSTESSHQHSHPLYAVVGHFLNDDAKVGKFLNFLYKKHILIKVNNIHQLLNIFASTPETYMQPFISYVNTINNNLGDLVENLDTFKMVSKALPLSERMEILNIFIDKNKLTSFIQSIDQLLESYESIKFPARITFLKNFIGQEKLSKLINNGSDLEKINQSISTYSGYSMDFLNLIDKKKLDGLKKWIH